MDPPLHKSQDIWRRVESSVPWSQHHLARDSEHSVSPCKAISKTENTKKTKWYKWFQIIQKCKHRPLDNGTPWGALRLVPLGHFHAFMALAVEWQLFAPTCDSLKNVLQPACMMSGRLRKSLYDLSLCIPDFALMKTRFKPLTLWKFQSRPEVRHTLLVLRQQQYACNDQIHSNAFI